VPEFEIHQCLGRGGFGEVYRGVMSRGGGIAMDVAVKVLRADLDPSSQGVQRLRDEGRLLGRLTHPTILRVYDLVVIEGRAALITEFVDGDDLARVIRGDDRPPPRAVFEIIAQVAAALDAAWSWPSVTDGQPLHLVHRDIKPDNIRLDPHGVVKLLDFGIAQASTIEREAETSVNIIMGSAQFLAPERMVQQEVGPESDVFALGCTLYEALAGEALFHRKSMRQMYLLMIEEKRLVDYLEERLEELPSQVLTDRARSLLLAMLAYHKADRPTAGDVAARCDAISDSLRGTTLRRWARAHDWPPPAEEEGPLEGRSYTTAQPLPAPGARTLHLRAPETQKPPPDLSETDTDPGNRVPVLGELDADAPGAPEAGPSPWSNAELVALDTASHEAEPASEPDADAPVDEGDASLEASAPPTLPPDEDLRPTQALRTDEVDRPAPGSDDEATAPDAPIPGPPADPDEEITDEPGPFAGSPAAAADEATDEPDTDEAGPTDAPPVPEAGQPAAASDAPAEVPPPDTGGSELPEVADDTTEPPEERAAQKGGRRRLLGGSNRLGAVLNNDGVFEDDDSPTVKMKVDPSPPKPSADATDSDDDHVQRALESLENTDTHAEGPDSLLAEALGETPPGVPRAVPDDEPALPDLGHDTGDEGEALERASEPGEPPRMLADVPAMPDPTDPGFGDPEVVDQSEVVESSGGLHIGDGVIDLQGTPALAPYRDDPTSEEVDAPAAPSDEAASGEAGPAGDDAIGPPEPTDAYEPKPGDVDLSDVVGGEGSGDVRLRVAPPGADVPERSRKRRRPNQPGRISVMLFSGLMGILVGAAIFSIPALIFWLVAG